MGASLFRSPSWKQVFLTDSPRSQPCSRRTCRGTALPCPLCAVSGCRTGLVYPASPEFRGQLRRAPPSGVWATPTWRPLAFVGAQHAAPQSPRHGDPSQSATLCYRITYVPLTSTMILRCNIPVLIPDCEDLDRDGNSTSIRGPVLG